MTGLACRCSGGLEAPVASPAPVHAPRLRRKDAEEGEEFSPGGAANERDRAPRAQRPHLGHEVGEVDAQGALPPLRRVRLSGDGHVEGGGSSPDVEWQDL